MLVRRETPARTLSTRSSIAAILRLTDILLAGIALVILLPLLVLIGLCVYVSDPGPIIFAHRRIGLGGRPFRCLKFRSMVIGAEERLNALLDADPALREAWVRDHKIPDDPRINALGAFLRRSSLDELPQVWNVLVGDMSFVGPRPIVEAETWRYGRYLPDYLSVRPGITGLWQISGRSDTSYRRRVALDVAYARSACISLYWKILVLTFPAVLLARGSY